MKKLLFLFALLISQYSYGQAEVGFNYGGEPWRRTFETETVHYDIHSVFGLTAAYNFSFLRIGFQYSWSKFTTSGTYGTPEDHRYYFADPMHEYNLLLAYFHQYNRTDWYAGVTGSMLRFHGHFDGKEPFTGITTSGKGVGYGIAFGSNYRIYKGLALNGQINACRANADVTTDGATVRENYWYFPITIGVHYEFMSTSCGL